VTIVVHAAEVTGGTHDVISPHADLAFRLAMFGMTPRSIIALRTVHVAPSSPRIKTRFQLGFSVIYQSPDQSFNSTGFVYSFLPGMTPQA
jgi:hypothetical protein